jgi:hypothetical protein
MLRSCLSMLSIEGLCLLDVSVRTGLFNLKFAGWTTIRKIVSEKLMVVRYYERSNASNS